MKHTFLRPIHLDYPIVYYPPIDPVNDLDFSSFISYFHAHSNDKAMLEEFIAGVSDVHYLNSFSQGYLQALQELEDFISTMKSNPSVQVISSVVDGMRKNIQPEELTDIEESNTFIELDGQALPFS